MRMASRVFCIISLAAAGVVPQAGCSSAGEGAVVGAGVGALTGLAIGSFSGNAGAGAAIGAAVGGGSGALAGGISEKRAREADEQARLVNAAQTPDPATGQVKADADRQALARFVGNWKLSGWSELDRYDRRSMSGTATGAVEQSYFLRLEVSASGGADGSESSHGVITLASEPGRGITMSSRFDNAPTVAEFAGPVTGGGTVFQLTEVDPPAKGVKRRILIRFMGQDKWTLEVVNIAASGKPQIASYTFTRS